MTFRMFMTKPEMIPTATSWYLADLGEARGKQELFTKQSPQRLKVLREHALIESAVSSNRIEGVEVEPARIKTILFGKGTLRDRDEEEVRGYRDALKLIHERSLALPVSEDTIKRLHRLARGRIGDAGRYKSQDSDIIERLPDGRTRVRFKTIPAARTAEAMSELLEQWGDCLGDRRVSRLLLLLQCSHLGYDVGRYISLERLIEENKERYYETLEHSSRGWHDGKHDPWPYVNFVLHPLKSAYREFEQRVGRTTAPKGAKTEMIEAAIAAYAGVFTLAELEQACPGISRDMVRKVLKDLQRRGAVECIGRGPGAKWRRKGKITKKGQQRG